MVSDKVSSVYDSSASSKPVEIYRASKPLGWGDQTPTSAAINEEKATILKVVPIKSRAILMYHSKKEFKLSRK